MRSFFALALAICASCGGDDTNTQNKAIGSPCAKSSDCGTGKFFCDSDHPNGYCKRDCQVDADCPAGSVCAAAKSNAPGECHKTCTQATMATDCRISEGYVCKANPDDASHDYCDVPE